VVVALSQEALRQGDRRKLALDRRKIADDTLPVFTVRFDGAPVLRVHAVTLPQFAASKRSAGSPFIDAFSSLPALK